MKHRLSRDAVANLAAVLFSQFKPSLSADEYSALCISIEDRLAEVTDQDKSICELFGSIAVEGLY